MYCDCNDYDVPEFINETKRRAVKKHICCECKSEINKGDDYYVITGKWDGEIRTYKTCEKCIDLRDSMVEAGYCPPIGDLYLYKAECIEEE